MNRKVSGRTITMGQRRDVFPERNVHWEIQDVPQNGIALGTWRVRQCGPLPFPNEGDDENAEQQRIEGKVINHCDKERIQEHRVGFYTGLQNE